MLGLNLTTEAAGSSLRRIAVPLGCPPRRAAWALATFGDERRAMAALVTPRHLELARLGVVGYVPAGAPAAAYRPEWKNHTAAFEQLLAEKEPNAPAPPKELTSYLLAYVDLEREVDPRIRSACKMGVRPAQILVARHRGGRSARAIADAAAIAVDAFPVGRGWVSETRARIVRGAGLAISKHLIMPDPPYQTLETAERRILRFLSVFEDDADVFLNRPSEGHPYAALTLATFEYGFAIVDRHRVGILVRTGND